MSAFFAIYDNAGNITRSGQCPAHLVAKQSKGAAERVMETDRLCCDIKDKIVAGKLKRRPDGEIASLQKKLDDDMKPGPNNLQNRLDRIERVFSQLKKQGIDLGPDGKDF